MMTVLNLTKGWLLRESTGETFGAQTAAGARGVKWAVEGGIVSHAGGRQRSYTVEGEAGVFERTFLELALPQVVLLRGWLGELVLYRDWRPGLYVYGTFFDLEQIEQPEPLVYNAKVTINLVSHVEGI